MAHADAPPASPPASLQPLALHGLSVEGVNQCVHCGLCLASCPTFSELGTEMDSPRGRIFLIKSLAEGRIVHIFVRADRLGEKTPIPDHVRRTLRRYGEADSLATSPITES